MEHDSRRKYNGVPQQQNSSGRVKVLPTSNGDRTRDSGRNQHNFQPVAQKDSRNQQTRPNNYRAGIVNTPEPLVYGIAALILTCGVVSVIVGAISLNDCKLEPMLPVWLLVMGIILALSSVWYAIYIRKLKKDPFRRVSSTDKIITYLFTFIFLGWFLAGHYFVYYAWANSPDFGHYWFDNGCEKSVFMLSFAGIILLDCAVGFSLIGCCLWGVSQVVVRE